MMPLAAQTGAYLPQGIDQTKIAQLIRSDPRIQRAIQQLQGMPQENLKEIVMQARAMQGNQSTMLTDEEKARANAPYITPPAEPWNPIETVPIIESDPRDDVESVPILEHNPEDDIESIPIAPPQPQYWTQDDKLPEKIEDVGKRLGVRPQDFNSADEYVKAQDYMPVEQQMPKWRYNFEKGDYEEFDAPKIETGQPIKLKAFHGSRSDIQEFREKSRGASTGAKSAEKAFFFTNDKQTAKDYAYSSPRIGRQWGGEGNPKAREYNIEMKNPLVHDYKGQQYREKSYNAIIEKAQKNGHDGVIFKNTYDPASSKDHMTTKINVYAVLNKDSIKTKDQLTEEWNKAKGNK